MKRLPTSDERLPIIKTAPSTAIVMSTLSRTAGNLDASVAHTAPLTKNCTASARRARRSRSLSIVPVCAGESGGDEHRSRSAGCFQVEGQTFDELARTLSRRELEVLFALIERSSDQAALRAQVSSLRVVGDCDCGCPTIWFASTTGVW